MTFINSQLCYVEESSHNQEGKKLIHEELDRCYWHKIYHSLTLCTRNYFPLYQNYFFIRAQNWGLPLQLHVTSCSSPRLIWFVLEMQPVSRQLRGASLFWEELKAVKRTGSAGRVHVLHTTSLTPHSLSPYPLLPHGKHVTLSLCNHDINWQCYFNNFLWWQQSYRALHIHVVMYVFRKNMGYIVNIDQSTNITNLNDNILGNLSNEWENVEQSIKSSYLPDI